MSEDFDIDNILTDDKSHWNILIYNISYNILIGTKSFRIRFDKIHGFIRIYDGTRCLTLFSSENYSAIHNRHRYLISLKSNINCIFYHYFAKIKADSFADFR